MNAILFVSALPGLSEYRTGGAIDVGAAAAPHLAVAFEDTPAFSWLQPNADRFGFDLWCPPGSARTNRA